MDEKGLYGKYRVTKADGTPVEDCFILCPEKDPAAVAALQAYAAATENEQLREDLYRWVGKPMRKPLTLDEVRHHCEMLHASPVWIETREAACWIYANVDDDEMIRGTLATIKDDWLDSNMVYGVSWRCWASRPTDEERTAAKWES